jgi:hypothetical protein
METKKNCQVQSRLFGIETVNGGINFFREQKIISAILKNAGSTTVFLWGGFPLLPNESITLGNNNIIGMFREDVIDIEFSGVGSNKLIIIVDKLG